MYFELQYSPVPDLRILDLMFNNAYGSSKLKCFHTTPPTELIQFLKVFTENGDF